MSVQRDSEDGSSGSKLEDELTLLSLDDNVDNNEIEDSEEVHCAQCWLCWIKSLISIVVSSLAVQISRHAAEKFSPAFPSA
jgi:hypothetical protein